MKLQLVAPKCFNDLNCERCKTKCAYYKTSIKKITQESISDNGIITYRVEYANGLEELLESRNDLLFESLRIDYNFLKEKIEVEDDDLLEEVEIYEDEYEDDDLLEEVEIYEDEYEDDDLLEEVEIYEDEYEDDDLLEEVELDISLIERDFELNYSIF